MLRPDKAGILGDRGLSGKAVNVADLSNNSSSVDLTDAWTTCNVPLRHIQKDVSQVHQSA